MPPRELGPTSYVSDYPPKSHEQFRAPAPYVPAPMVSLENTTSYALDYPPKTDEKRTRVPDREYRELNFAQGIPAGSTTHAQFPGHMPGYPTAYQPYEVPAPPAAGEAPVYRPPEVPAPPAPFFAPPVKFAVSSEPTPATHYQKTMVAHKPAPREAYTTSWPPEVDAPAPPEKIVVNRPPITAPVGWRLPLNRSALGFRVGTAEPTCVMHKMIDAGSGPAAGKAVLTTVRDNQEKLCILIMHCNAEEGDPCELLGQFDVVGIPKQPAGKPRIQICFQVDNQGFLKVWARELDTNKHKVWIANGGKIVATK